MFTTDAITKFLYLDIETVSSYQSLEVLERENPRLHKLWKKRELYYKGAYEEMKIATPEEIYSAKAGLEPEFSKIVCVSFGTFESTSALEKRFISFYGEDEIDILNKTSKVLNNAHSKNWKLCGHNIKGFDVPCLGKRMLYNRMQPPAIIRVSDKKPWEIPFVDTSEIFAFGSWVQQKSLSLDLLSCSLGIPSPKDNMDGSMVGEYFWERRDFESIKKYCEMDVSTVMDVLSNTAI